MRHIGTEQTITVGKRTYRLSRLTRGIIRQLFAWCCEQAPSPLELAKRHIDDWPCPQGLIEVTEELMQLYGTEDDQTFVELNGSPEGDFRLFCLLMVKYHTDLSEERLWALFRQIDPTKWLYLQQQASGVFTTERQAEEGMFRHLGWMPAGKSKRTSWEEIDRDIFQNCYLRPQDVDEMTLPEIAAVIQPKEEPTTVANAAQALANASVQFYKHLTPTHRLELLQRRFGFTSPLEYRS